MEIREKKVGGDCLEPLKVFQDEKWMGSSVFCREILKSRQIQG